jgi:hypothetical protein
MLQGGSANIGLQTCRVRVLWGGGGGTKGGNTGGCRRGELPGGGGGEYGLPFSLSQIFSTTTVRTFSYIVFLVEVILME